MKKRSLVSVLLLVLLFGFGCGKSNESGEEANNNNVSNTNPFTNSNGNNYVGNQQCGQAFNRDQLRSVVNNGQFISEYYSFETYHMQEIRTNINESELFGIDWLSYNTISYDVIDEFQRSANRGFDSANHEYGNSKNAIRTQLLSIIDSATGYRSNGGSYHEVMTSNGDIYGINLCYPIAANPTMIYKKNSDTTVLLRYISGQ